MHIAKRSVLPANAVHHACLSFVNVHQMAPPLTEVKKHPIAAYYASIDPEGMKG